MRRLQSNSVNTNETKMAISTVWYTAALIAISYAIL